MLNMNTWYDTEFYPGETGILRYALFINQSFNYFDLKIKITSDLLPDQFQLQKLFIANIGDNFPCVSLQTPVEYKNGLVSI